MFLYPLSRAYLACSSQDTDLGQCDLELVFGLIELMNAWILVTLMMLTTKLLLLIFDSTSHQAKAKD